MRSNAEIAVDTRLELIAAKAKQMAEDHKAGRMWPGDLARGLRELNEQLAALWNTQEARDGHRY